MTLREFIEAVRSAPAPENEKAVEAKIVSPVLELLGWDSWHDVHYQYAPGDSRTKADIALKAKKKVLAFIEAKASNSDLKGHVRQILGYAFEQGVGFCILTNGLEWWFYLPLEEGPPDSRCFARVHFKRDPADQVVEDLAKQALKAQQDADYLNTEAPGIWRAMLEGPDEELAELISKHIYDKVGLRPTKKQLKAIIGGSPVPTSPLSPTPAPKPSPKPGPKTPSRDKPVGFRFLGHAEQFKSWVNMIWKVADILYEKHENMFMEIKDKRGRVIISSNLDAFKPSAGTRIIKNSNYYVDAHPAKHFRTRTFQALLAYFGYSDSDLEVFYDASMAPNLKPPSRPLGKHPVPTGFRFKGIYVPVNPAKNHGKLDANREFLIRLAGMLYERHADEFSKVLEWRGNKLLYFSRHPGDLRVPSSPIGKGNDLYYFEMHVNVIKWPRVPYQLIKLFGYSDSDLEVFYE